MITKEKITGMVGSIIFMVLLLVVLLFSYFTLSNPAQELEGIPVMFGNMEEAAGFEEPPMQELTPPAPQVKTPQNVPAQAPLISQTTDPSIAVNEVKNKQKEEEDRKRQAVLAEQRRQQETAERQRREEEARRRAINQEMSGLFGENANATRGSTEGQGTQGVSTGNANQGATTGMGGIGTFNLGGRSLGSGGLTQPRYTVDDYGTVVVRITVDPKGNVISAEIGPGTNAPSSTLKNEALKAAQSTKFNAITSTNNQQGTITYKFKLN